MLVKSLIGRVLLQLLGVGAYFALVVILYWRGLTDAGAVASCLARFSVALKNRPRR